MKKKDMLKKSNFIVVLILIVAAVAVILSIAIKNLVNEAIYSERKEALSQLIYASAESINNNMDIEWDIAGVYKNDLEAHLNEYSNVEDYLKYLNTQLSTDDDYYFLVDSKGRYYCTDGYQGKITDTKYYLDSTAEELEYLDTLPHFTTDTTYLILRTKLDTPIKTNSENGEIEIKYCALMHNPTPLMECVKSLFEGKNNFIIYDTDNGLMLFKQFGIRLLIDGYNIYDKYHKVNFLYDANGDEIIEQIKNKEINVSLMNINGEIYYACSSPLNVANWSLLLIVEGSYFNAHSANVFGTIIAIIIEIVVVAAVLVVLVIWYFNKHKTNRQLLDNERKLNDSLNDAYQIKSNFLSYMSHDIRTPINGMIGMAKIGLENSSNQEKVEDCFNKIDLSSKHLLAIVNDVLDMSAIEAGKIVITSDEMNVVKTVKGCLDIIKGTLNNRVLNVEEEYVDNDQLVLGDEFHLKQVLINILSNAVKFTPDGGSIKVNCKELSVDDDTINYEISISDTGVGMSPEFKEHIFEAFKTANPSSKAKYKGSGLGMAISNEYVKLMNGTIVVESELNVGSTFIVTIPFKKIKEETHELDLKNLNVLLVEDNEINMEITKEMLKDEVKSITCASNGKIAVDTFMESSEHYFDLILMDCMMPVMNGLDATKAIRASNRSDNDLLIIALTANTYKDDIEALFEAGMNGYLNKPFSVYQLLDKIRKGDIK